MNNTFLNDPQNSCESVSPTNELVVCDMVIVRAMYGCNCNINAQCFEIQEMEMAFTHKQSMAWPSLQVHSNPTKLHP